MINNNTYDLLREEVDEHFDVVFEVNRKLIDTSLIDNYNSFTTKIDSFYEAIIREKEFQEIEYEIISELFWQFVEDCEYNDFENMDILEDLIYESKIYKDKIKHRTISDKFKEVLDEVESFET